MTFATIKEINPAIVYVNHHGVVKVAHASKEEAAELLAQEWTADVVTALEAIADFPSMADDKRTIAEARKADMDEARVLMLWIKAKCRECAIFKQTMFHARAIEAWTEISRNYRDVNPICKSPYDVRTCWEPIKKSA